jgi:hypothetical protein
MRRSIRVPEDSVRGKRASGNAGGRAADMAGLRLRSRSSPMMLRLSNRLDVRGPRAESKPLLPLHFYPRHWPSNHIHNLQQLPQRSLLRPQVC